jgi:hypothetical protein
MSAWNDMWNEADFLGGPLLAAPIRGVTEERLDQFKQQLLGPILASVDSASLSMALRAVANEAAALAWCTVCPILVLPALLEEKTRMALAHWDRQQRLRQSRNVAVNDSLPQPADPPKSMAS